EDSHLVGLVGPLGGRDQAIDGLAHQRFQLWIVIDAAIGGEDALVFLFGSRRGGDSVVRLDGRRGTLDRSSLETTHVAAGRQRRCQNQQRRRSQKPAAHSHVAPSRKPIHVSYSSSLIEVC